MKVLFATDFSPASRKAGDCLGELEGLDQAVLLHVVEDEGEGAGEERLGADRRRELAAMSDSLQEGGAKVSMRGHLFGAGQGARGHRQGGSGTWGGHDRPRFPGRRIPAPSVRGQSRIAELLWGSTAEALVRRGSLPVLVVPRRG